VMSLCIGPCLLLSPACSAEGRYLSAVRDLNMPPVLDSTRLSPAAQWKVTGQGISNVMHPHKVRMNQLVLVHKCEHRLVGEQGRERAARLGAAGIGYRAQVLLPAHAACAPVASMCQLLLLLLLLSTEAVLHRC
jgi:hypothetical protein